MGVLRDIAAADGGDGGGDAALLRGPRRAGARPRRRRIRLALLPLLRRPRSHRHLDGAIPPPPCTLLPPPLRATLLVLPRRPARDLCKLPAVSVRPCHVRDHFGC